MPVEGEEEFGLIPLELPKTGLNRLGLFWSDLSQPEFDTNQSSQWELEWDYDTLLSGEN